jgi:uncharacterized phage infection (PIP) family protein YhgE
MDKYLKNINSSGSKHQMYKRCIFDIIKDMTENIKLFHSNILKIKKNQTEIIVKIKQINDYTEKYIKNFTNVNEIINKYNEQYSLYSIKINDINTKVNIIPTLKKIKEKHVQEAYNYLETINNYWIELDNINSSINYSFINKIFKKVKEELSEISVISGLIDDIEITNSNNITNKNKWKSLFLEKYEDEYDDDFM